MWFASSVALGKGPGSEPEVPDPSGPWTLPGSRGGPDPLHMEEPRELRVLSRSECLELLSSAGLGRVILSAHALPTAMPVNYALDGDWIVFRSGAGMKLSAADAGTVVAFEVDHFDTDLRMGWSVVVTGVAKTIVEPHEVARAQALGVPTWVHAQDHLDFVRIEIGSVTGRRLVPVPAGAAAGVRGHAT